MTDALKTPQTIQVKAYPQYVAQPTFPKLATLTDNFDDNTIDTSKWIVAYPDSVAEVSGKLRLSALTAFTDPSITSGIFDLSGSEVSWEGYFPPLHDTSIELIDAANGKSLASILIWDDSGNSYISISYPRDPWVSGADVWNYDPYGAHRWMRFRESAGVLYVETSSNRTSWTARYSDGYAPSGMMVKLRFRMNVSSSGSESYAYIDNVNTSPTTPDPTLATVTARTGTTSDSFTLPAGYDKPHGVLVYREHLYLGMRTTPARISKHNINNLADVSYLTLPNDGYHSQAEQMVETGGWIYALHSHDTRITVSKIDPTSLTATDFVSDTSHGASPRNSGSIATDGTHLYVLCSSSFSSWLDKYSLVDGSKSGSVQISRRPAGHAMRYDSSTGKLYAFGGTILLTSGWVARVDPTTLTVERSVDLAGLGTQYGMTDDFAISGDYLWAAGEAAPRGPVRILKSDLSQVTRVEYGTGSDPYCVMEDPDGWIWMLQSASTNNCVRINPSNLSEVFRYSLATTPNELVPMGDGTYLYTTFTSPAQVHRWNPDDIAPASTIASVPWFKVSAGVPQASVVIGNAPPTAVATATPNPVANAQTAIFLDGTGSFDIDGTIVSYQWELVSGPTSGAFDTPAGATATFTPSVAGHTTASPSTIAVTAGLDMATPSVPAQTITETWPTVGATISGDQTWTEVSSDWTVNASNRAQIATNVDGSARSETSVGTVHQDVAVDYWWTDTAATPNYYAGPAARFDPSSNSYYAFVVRASGTTGSRKLVRVVNGELIPLVAVNNPVTNGSRLRITVETVGSAVLIRGYVAGVQVIEHIDRDGARLVSGQHAGVAAHWIGGVAPTGVTVEFDNWSATQYASATRLLDPVRASVAMPLARPSPSPARGQVQIATSSGMGTSPSVTLPAAPTNGNKLICLLYLNQSTATTETLPTGFTQRAKGTNLGDSMVVIADKTASGDGATFTAGNSWGEGWVMTVIERNDLGDFVTANGGTFGATDTTSLTLGYVPVDGYVVAASAIQSDTDSVTSWSNSFTELVAHTNGLGSFPSRDVRGVSAELAVGASSGSKTATATYTSAVTEPAFAVAAWRSNAPASTLLDEADFYWSKRDLKTGDTVWYDRIGAAAMTLNKAAVLDEFNRLVLDATKNGGTLNFGNLPDEARPSISLAAGEYTVLVAGKFDTQSTVPIWDMRIGGANGAYMYANSATTILGRILVDNASAGVSRSIAAGVTDAYRLFGWRYDAPYQNTYVSGVGAGADADTNTIGDWTHAVHPTGARVGNYAYAQASGDFDLGDVLIFNRALTAAEMDEIGKLLGVTF
jgi:hypothetical protein